MPNSQHPGDPDSPPAGTPSAAGGSSLDLHSSVELVQLAGRGDSRALDILYSRYYPRLHQWATGRLPTWSRSLLDTHDMVQDVLLRSIRQLENFEHRQSGGFHAYLRQSLQNRMRDEIRAASRRPRADMEPEQLVDRGASPLEEAIGADMLQSYETALGRLRDEDRECIIARVEWGMSYAELALELGKPSPDAARVAVGRALVRLAQEMGHEP